MSPNRTEPSSRAYAWYVVAVLTLASISGNIDQFVLTLLVAPIKRDFGVSDVQVGYLGGAAFAILFAVLGLPFARVADRYNRRNLIAAGVTTWSLFTAVGALARTFGQLFATRVGVGVGEATLNPSAVSLIADYFAPAMRARAMSVFSTAVYCGAGVGYFVGGWLVGLLDAAASWTVPVIGTIHPWQTVFLAVGLPGLAVAALMLTIREPVRAANGAAQLPLSAFVRYVSANRRTFVTQISAYACYTLVNIGIAVWVATFFIRTFAWTASQAGRVQGLLTMTLGTASVVGGGWLSDRLAARGYVDAPLRVGMIGAAGMLVFATSFPLMPTASLAIAGLAAVNIFAALPFGAASAAAAAIVPAPMRAQGVALYFFVVVIVSRTLGPLAVAWLTERVFHDPAAIGYALAIVSAAGMLAALAFFAAALRSYRRTIEYREQWTPWTNLQEHRS